MKIQYKTRVYAMPLNRKIIFKFVLRVLKTPSKNVLFSSCRLQNRDIANIYGLQRNKLPLYYMYAKL